MFETEKIVKGILSEGFELDERGWFYIILKRGNVTIKMTENVSRVTIYDKETDTYSVSDDMNNKDLFECIKKKNLNNIKTTKLPF